MTPKQIQDTLKKKKITQKMIAVRADKSEMSVSKVCRKLMISDRIMAEVAKAIGKPKEKVFPEYYYGPRLRSTSKAMGQQK